MTRGRARCLFLATLLLSLIASSRPVRAAAWPMVGADAAHTSSTPDDLSKDLALHWSITLPRLSPAWPDQTRLRDDGVYLPIVSNGRLIVASPLDDSLAAHAVADGRELWRFFTQGPIRVAPAADNAGRVFVGSDDGFIYALDVETGKLLWKFKAAPGSTELAEVKTRRVLGNGRLIDTWPIRGGPVIADGKLYVAAGVWPFMGVFIHCLDPATGKPFWTSSGDGAAFLTQPHGDPSFGGPAPQGSLAVVGDKLLVPTGRSVAACYDRKTGKLLHYALATKFGGDRLAMTGTSYVAGNVVFRLATGKPAMFVPPSPVFVGETAYAPTREGIAVYRPDDPNPDEAARKLIGLPAAHIVTAPVATESTTLIRAGNRLYAGGKGSVTAIDLPLNIESPDPAWQAPIAGTVAELLAAEGRLFAVTEEGQIHCLGPNQFAPPAIDAPAAAPASRPAENLIARLPRDLPDSGYCLALGTHTEPLVRELIARTTMHVVLLEPDATAADRLRRRFHADALYGQRLAVITGELTTATLPPYFASLILSSDPVPESAFEPLFRALHPYRGVAWMAADQRLAKSVQSWASANAPGRASVSIEGAFLRLSRINGPPGGGNWTHEHADAANTRVSKDSIVKAPLGILWFGGSSHDGALPRHGHGPQPQVIDGRVITEGTDSIRALDLYTGRLLWETPIDGVGSFFNATAHQPGANGSGSNFVSTSDGIYVACARFCARIDPATGAKLAEFPLPQGLATQQTWVWGYLNVEGDYLIGGAGPRGKATVLDAMPQEDPDPFEDPDPNPEKVPVTNPRPVSSHSLFVMDRRTGKLLWSVSAEHDFRHNAVCAGGGRLFAIDLNAGDAPVVLLRSRQPANARKGTLRVFDLATGRPVWSDADTAFGTFLSFSSEHDILVEAGRKARDTLKDEATAMRGYDAKTGKILWTNLKAAGPAMIRGKTVLTDNSAADLLTGEALPHTDPLTGENCPWTWTRLYGCNTPLASEHLLTFRSGAAGFYDLARQGGTGNFGGFRSGCTNNLIVAGGVLVAPDYTRTCTCAYPLQTSLALIPDPDAEMWTFAGTNAEVRSKLRRIGINLGAPGDRVADDGTLWLEYPSVGGKSPNVRVNVTGDHVEYFRRHSSAVAGPLPWVTASGVKGFRKVAVTIDAAGAETHPYTVRLYFAHPTDIPDGSFGVLLQGQQVERDLNVASAAAGRNRTLIREYHNIEAAADLVVELRPTTKTSIPFLCGIEILAEEP